MIALHILNHELIDSPEFRFPDSHPGDVVDRLLGLAASQKWRVLRERVTAGRGFGSGGCLVSTRPSPCPQTTRIPPHATGISQPLGSWGAHLPGLHTVCA